MPWSFFSDNRDNISALISLIRINSVDILLASRCGHAKARPHHTHALMKRTKRIKRVKTNQ